MSRLREEQTTAMSRLREEQTTAMSRLREEQTTAMSRLREEQTTAMSRLREEQTTWSSVPLPACERGRPVGPRRVDGPQCRRVGDGVRGQNPAHRNGIDDLTGKHHPHRLVQRQ